MVCIVPDGAVGDAGVCGLGEAVLRLWSWEGAMVVVEGGGYG